MKVEFEELDFQETPLGDISLRRRSELKLAGKIVYEVKLGDEFLMSSLFTDGEIQLAQLGLAALEGSDLDIVVGGLGLGYTAAAALEEVHKIGKRFYAQGGGYKLKGYFKTLKGDGW